MEKQKIKEGIPWVLLLSAILVILIGIAFDKGLEKGISEREDCSEIDERYNQIIKDMATENSRRCVNYFCEEVLNGTYVEPQINDSAGSCKEEWRTMTSKEACVNILVGE